MKWYTGLNCLFTIIFGLMRCINKYAIDDVSGLQTQKVSHTTANETMENKNVPPFIISHHCLIFYRFCHQDLVISKLFRIFVADKQEL